MTEILLELLITEAGLGQKFGRYDCWKQHFNNIDM